MKKSHCFLPVFLAKTTVWNGSRVAIKWSVVAPSSFLSGLKSKLENAEHAASLPCVPRSIAAAPAVNAMSLKACILRHVPC